MFIELVWWIKLIKSRERVDEMQTAKLGKGWVCEN